MDTFWLFFLLALVAEIVGTISGFGSSILFVPFATLFFDFEVVLGITAVFHVFSNITKIIFFHHGINKNIVLKLGIPAILFVIFGALLTTYIALNHIEFAMNLVIFGLAIYLMFNFNKKVKQSNFNLVFGGIISGFLAGLVGTGGAIRGITMVAFNLNKNAFIATSAIIDLGIDLSRAVIYIASGYFLMENLWLIPGLILVSIVGTWLGKKILNYTSESLFRYIVLFVIIGISVIQTVRYFIA